MCDCLSARGHEDLGNAVLSEQLASFAKMMHSMREHLVRIKLVCVKEVSYKQQGLAAGWLFIWKSGIWKSAARPRPAHQDFFCSFRLGSFRFDEERRNEMGETILGGLHHQYGRM